MEELLAQNRGSSIAKDVPLRYRDAVEKKLRLARYMPKLGYYNYQVPLHSVQPVPAAPARASRDKRKLIFAEYPKKHELTRLELKNAMALFHQRVIDSDIVLRDLLWKCGHGAQDTPFEEVAAILQRYQIHFPLSRPLPLDVFVSLLETLKYRHLARLRDPSGDMADAFVSFGGGSDKSGVVSTSAVLAACQSVDVTRGELTTQVMELLQRFSERGEMTFSQFCDFLTALQEFRATPTTVNNQCWPPAQLSIPRQRELDSEEGGDELSDSSCSVDSFFGDSSPLQAWKPAPHLAEVDLTIPLEDELYAELHPSARKKEVVKDDDDLERQKDEMERAQQLYRQYTHTEDIEHDVQKDKQKKLESKNRIMQGTFNIQPIAETPAQFEKEERDAAAAQRRMSMTSVNQLPLSRGVQSKFNIILTKYFADAVTRQEEAKKQLPSGPRKSRQGKTKRVIFYPNGKLALLRPAFVPSRAEAPRCLRAHEELLQAIQRKMENQETDDENSSVTESEDDSSSEVHSESSSSSVESRKFPTTAEVDIAPPLPPNIFDYEVGPAEEWVRGRWHTQKALKRLYPMAPKRLWQEIGEPTRHQPPDRPRSERASAASLGAFAPTTDPLVPPARANLKHGHWEFPQSTQVRAPSAMDEVIRGVLRKNRSLPA